MTQEEFDRLTERYLDGKCSPEEIVLLREWADLHFGEQSEARLFSSASEEVETGSRLWASLHIKAKNRSFWRRHSFWLAASVLVGGVVLAFFIDPAQRPRETTETSTNAPATLTSSSKVTLPDGSVVILEEGADIVTDKEFGLRDRKVILTGGAYFDVRSDREHPFIVITEDLVTEVLGTSFRIKQETRLKKIEVSVHAGKVSVYTAEQKGARRKDGVIAMPNQKVSYDLVSKTLKQDLVDQPKPLIEKGNKKELVFDDVSVQQVFTAISDLYGVQLIAGSEAIANCTFAGDLSGLDMYRQIDVICEVVGLEYEVRGTTIFISGNGCRK